MEKLGILEGILFVVGNEGISASELMDILELKEDNINNQKNKVLDIMALAVNATDPENELHGISTEDLVQAGLQILRPEPQKLGNVGDIQGAQESAPRQAYSPISPVT